MSAGKFAGSGSCENSVMVWFPLWKGERSLLNVGGEETSFWCVPGSVTWTTLTWHSTPTGCNNHTKKHRQELRCSKKPPTLSYSDFTSKFNSILQHQAGSDKCIVPCTGFMEYFLETSGSGWVGGGGVSVHIWVCTTTDYSQITEKHFQGNKQPPSPFSLLCLLPSLVTLSL